jgi:hypothetical protein
MDVHGLGEIALSKHFEHAGHFIKSPVSVCTMPSASRSVLRGTGFQRTGLDWTKRFSVIAGALELPGRAIIDGEVVVIKDGRTNFSELQAELAAGQ